jgi:hypothetical protein
MVPDSPGLDRISGHIYLHGKGGKVI